MATTFYIEQFGCRATQADAAAIERQLLDRGCTPTRESASAEFVVVNTCTVTAAADAQARDAIRKIHAANPNARIIATGCYAQRAPEDLATLPGVAWVVGNSHKPHIPNLIATHPSVETEPQLDFVPLTNLASSPAGAQHCYAPSRQDRATGRPTQILISDIFDNAEFLSAPVQGGESDHTRPTLKIQDGCNLRCAFCVIPFVRGKSRSLPPNEVVNEIRRLTAEQALLPVPPATTPRFSRAREIVLSGINLGTYGRDLTPRADFLALLRRILDETEIERLRLSSIEPQDVTRDLIDLFAETHRLADHFHMPLQSGSDKILAAMHRWYRADHYARRVELIRERLPHAAIGADVIAGFPGETEGDHAATLAFIERLPFTYLHVFSYSQRPGTKAAALADQVPGHIIKGRARELRALGEKKSAAFRQAQQGRTLSVLTLRGKFEPRQESPQEEKFTPAISSNYARVQLSGVYAPNLFRDVRITNVADAQLIGE